MRLAAIYNIWDGDELLIPSMKQMEKYVDLFILVYQTKSNFGEEYNPMAYKFENIKKSIGAEIELAMYIPELTGSKTDGTNNELAKRNYGLKLARLHKCTHFLFVDCDEFYEDFALAKSEFKYGKMTGSVCRLYTYFKSPELRFTNLDSYYVPFIHELSKTTRSRIGQYPFTVDPTRRVSSHTVKLITSVMHHYSWVRKDIGRKMRNSSARFNMEKWTTILDDYNNANEGMIVKDYDNKSPLIKVPELFNLKPIFE